MKRTMFIALIVSCLAGVSFPQDNEEVKLPDSVMRQMVNRIVTWHFKPRQRRTTLYFWNPDIQIKNEWLPNIRNIEFVVLQDTQGSTGRKGYTIANLLKHRHGLYTIGLGYGDLNCGEGSGGTWAFRITRRGIRLWQTTEKWGWGTACD